MEDYNQQQNERSSTAQPTKNAMVVVLKAVAELLLVITLGIVIIGATPVTPLVAQPIIIVYLILKFCKL